MAITWECKISNVDVVQKRADVRFQRLDSDTGEVESYMYSGVILETTAQRTALLNQAWEAHLEEESKKTAVDLFVTNLEALAKSNLEARET